MKKNMHLAFLNPPETIKQKGPKGLNTRDERFIPNSNPLMPTSFETKPKVLFQEITVPN